MSNRRYDPGYIQEALKLADEVGVKEAAKQLGISVNTLSYWRVGKATRQANKPDSKDPKDKKIKEQAARIKTLTEAGDAKDQRITDLEKQVEILKATISFFALDRKD